MTKRFLRLLPICVLLCLTSCTGRSDHWLSLLEQAEEMNRNDVPFTSDSLGLALVRHYDHWWHSPYLRLRAYYMLGSAYRDMGEAPRALENYQMAVKQVDIATAPDSTLDVLMRVHSQMSEIFLIQRLPEQEKKELLSARQLAWQIGDTVSALTFESFLCNLLYKNNEYEQCIRQSISLSRKFSSCNLKDRALLTYVYCVKSYLAMGNFPKAKKYLDLYETCSFFHDNPKMVSGGIGALHELKGEYFLGIANVDSAEHYFRKTLEEKELGSNGILGYKGMYLVFEARHEADSILKYTRLYSESKEKCFDEAQSAATLQSSAMYRYERNQNLALANAHRATRFRLLSFIILLLSALLFSTVYIIFRRRSQKQEMKLRQLNGNLMNTMQEREQLLEEYEILKREHERTESSKDIMALIGQKQEKIAQLDETIRNYQEKLGAMTYSQRKKLLMGNDIVEYFIRKKTLTPAWKAPTIDKWMALSDVYSQYMPLVAAAMDRAELSRQELLTTILTHLDFSPGDIAILLETGKSRISSVKKSACRKLFEEDGVILKQRLVDMESGGFMNNFSTP